MMVEIVSPRRSAASLSACINSAGILIYNADRLTGLFFFVMHERYIAHHKEQALRLTFACSELSFWA